MGVWGVEDTGWTSGRWPCPLKGEFHPQRRPTVRLHPVTIASALPVAMSGTAIPSGRRGRKRTRLAAGANDKGPAWVTPTGVRIGRPRHSSDGMAWPKPQRVGTQSTAATACSNAPRPRRAHRGGSQEAHRSPVLVRHSPALPWCSGVRTTKRVDAVTRRGDGDHCGDWRRGVGIYQAAGRLMSSPQVADVAVVVALPLATLHLGSFRSATSQVLCRRLPSSTMLYSAMHFFVDMILSGGFHGFRQNGSHYCLEAH